MRQAAVDDDAVDENVEEQAAKDAEPEGKHGCPSTEVKKGICEIEICSSISYEGSY